MTRNTTSLLNAVETQRYETVKERVTALALMNCGENPLLLAIKVRRFPSPLICVHEVAFPVSFKDIAKSGKTYFHKYFSNGLICEGAEAFLGHRNTIA